MCTGPVELSLKFVLNFILNLWLLMCHQQDSTPSETMCSLKRTTFFPPLSPARPPFPALHIPHKTPHRAPSWLDGHITVQLSEGYIQHLQYIK